MLSYYKLSQTHQNTEQHQTLPVGSHTHTSMSHFLCWSHEVNVPKLNPQRHTTDHTAWKQEQSLCVCVASSSDLRWTWEVCVCVRVCSTVRVFPGQWVSPTLSQHAQWGPSAVYGGQQWARSGHENPTTSPLTPHTHMTRGTRIESFWAKGHVSEEEKRSLWDDERK